MVDMTDPSQFMASRVQQLVAQGMSRDQAVTQARAEMAQAGIGGAQGGPNVDMQALLGDKPSGGFQGSLDGQGLYADRGTPWFDAPIVQPQGVSPQGAPPSGAGSGAAPGQGPAPQDGAPPQAGPQAPSAPAGAASGAPIAPAPPINEQARDAYMRSVYAPGKSPAEQAAAAKGPNVPAAPGPAAGPQAGPPGAPVPPPPPGNGAPAQAAPGAEQAARNEKVYGYQGNDNFETWAYRTLQQGLADNGKNPYLAANPMANNPWDSWLRSRYGMQQASGNLMSTLSSPTLPSDAAQQGMAGLAKYNVGGDMFGGLHNLAGLESRVTGGDTSGMDPGQLQRLQLLNASPDQTKALLLGAYTQKYGMMGSDIVRQKLDSAEQMFQNDPSNQGAATVPFYNYALNKLGF